MKRYLIRYHVLNAASPYISAHIGDMSRILMDGQLKTMLIKTTFISNESRCISTNDV